VSHNITFATLWYGEFKVKGSVLELMPMPEHFPAGISLPWWQVGVVLIGFPALYFGNYFMPWTKGLFKERDHRHFFPFWGSIAFLHWASAGLVVLFVSQAGWQLADVGLKMPASHFALMLGAFAVIGAVVVLLRQSAPHNRASKFPEMMQLMLPSMRVLQRPQSVLNSTEPGGVKNLDNKRNETTSTALMTSWNRGACRDAYTLWVMWKT